MFSNCVTTSVRFWFFSDITVCITTAFGGVLVFGALDHSQIDAIDVSEHAFFA